MRSHSNSAIVLALLMSCLAVYALAEQTAPASPGRLSGNSGYFTMSGPTLTESSFFAESVPDTFTLWIWLTPLEDGLTCAQYKILLPENVAVISEISNAAISVEGRIIIGDTRLETEPGIYAWLIADSEQEVYAAYNFTDQLAPIKLETPSGIVQADGIGFSKIVLRTKGNPTLEIWAAERSGVIAFPVFPEMKIMYNGEDVTEKITIEKMGDGQIAILP